jgi:uncharacterized metal-binding protein
MHNMIIDSTFSCYLGDSEKARLARAATKAEGLAYYRDKNGKAKAPRWTRVESTVALARIMGYNRIGIASCVGLLVETKNLAMILERQGFETCTICCKAGRIDKTKLGVGEETKVAPGTFEPICNPIAQAEMLNARKTDMNVIMGLCVGHDMLFSMHSKAPVTTLVVKDRVTGHNPAAALYGQNFYYKRLQKEQIHIDDVEE